MKLINVLTSSLISFFLANYLSFTHTILSKKIDGIDHLIEPVSNHLFFYTLIFLIIAHGLFRYSFLFLLSGAIVSLIAGYHIQINEISLLEDPLLIVIYSILPFMTLIVPTKN